MKTQRLILNVANATLNRINETLNAIPDESLSSFVRHALHFTASVIDYRRQTPNGTLVVKDKAGVSLEIVLPDAGSFATVPSATAENTTADRKTIEVRTADRDERNIAAIQGYLGGGTRTLAVGLALGIYDEVLGCHQSGMEPYFETPSGTATHEVKLAFAFGTPALPPATPTPHFPEDFPDDPPELMSPPRLAMWELRDEPKQLIIASKRHAIRGWERKLFAEPMSNNLQRGVRYIYGCWNTADVRDLIASIRDYVLPLMKSSESMAPWYESKVFGLIDVIQIHRDAIGAQGLALVDLFPCGYELWLRTGKSGTRGLAIETSDDGILGGSTLRLEECARQKKRLLDLGPVSLKDTDEFDAIVSKQFSRSEGGNYTRKRRATPLQTRPKVIYRMVSRSTSAPKFGNLS